MAFGGLTNFFGKKNQETAATNAVRQQAQADLTKTKRDLNDKFSHLEELVATTLEELKTWRVPSIPQHQEKKQ